MGIWFDAIFHSNSDLKGDFQPVSAASAQRDLLKLSEKHQIQNLIKSWENPWNLHNTLAISLECKLYAIQQQSETYR